MKTPNYKLFDVVKHEYDRGNKSHTDLPFKYYTVAGKMQRVSDDTYLHEYVLV